MDVRWLDVQGDGCEENLLREDPVSERDSGS